MHKFQLIRTAMRHEFGHPASLLVRFRPQLALRDGEDGAGGAGTPTPAELQAQILALTNKNKELIGEVRSARENVKKYEGLDPEKARAAMTAAEKAEEDRARAAGEFDKLRGTLIDNHKKELEGATGKLNKTTSFLYRQLSTGAIGSALVGKDGQPFGNVTLLAPHLQRFIKVNENPNSLSEDDAFVIQVVDSNGQVRVKDGQGTPFSVADLVAEYQKKPEFAGAFFAPNSSGGGSTGNAHGNGSSSSEIVLSKADGRDPLKYRAAKERATKEGKTVRILAE